MIKLIGSFFFVHDVHSTYVVVLLLCYNKAAYHFTGTCTFLSSLYFLQWMYRDEIGRHQYCFIIHPLDRVNAFCFKSLNFSLFYSFIRLDLRGFRKMFPVSFYSFGPKNIFLKQLKLKYLLVAKNETI